MWNRFNQPVAIVASALTIAASLVITDTGFAVLKRNYTPQEFRSVLRGLGYNVKVVNTPLTDATTKKAIREFQNGYDLSADGTAGPRTQSVAANIVEILQANLNLVLKSKPPVPRTQFYGPQTEAAVKQYQQKSGLTQTGIADLALRQKLDKEAENLLNQPATTTPRRRTKPKPQATPTTQPSPGATPTSTPTSTPEATPTSTPTSTPEATPTSTPTSTPEPTATPSPKPSVTPK